MADDTDEDYQAIDNDDIVKPLSEDNDSPFTPPIDPIEDPNESLEIREARGRLGQTDPATDSASDIDSHELYDEGLSGAAGAEEPNAGNAVVSYDPEADKRKNK